MTKATKLDKEIQEGLYDPKTKGKGTMTQEFKEREEAMLRIWNELDSPKYQKIAKQLKKERAKGYDPKQSHVYKVGWKAKTGFKVKSFWTKAEMDKQVAILKKAGIWYRAWQAGTDKVYDPKAGYGEHYPHFKVVPIIVDYDKHGKKLYYQAIDRAFKKRISEKIVKSLLKEGRAVFDEYQAGAINMPELYADPKTTSLPPVRWYEAMVRGIKKSSDVRNPYAIVKSIWSKLSSSKKAEIKAREKKGERFKYDLPLPVDKPTRGTGTVRMVKPFKLAEVQVNLSVKDYLTARASGLFQRMKREDGTTALVARCKSPQKNVNVFVDKAGK